jgi:hypothetical protein
MPFSEPSFLLPGESLHDFEAIRQMMIDDIQPKTNIEWLWTLARPIREGAVFWSD